MKRQNKLLTGLLCACIALGAQFTATSALAKQQKPSGPPKTVSQALKLKYPKHKNQVASPDVGKKIGKAYELYSEEKIAEALEVLADIKTKDSAFDKAYTAYFKAMIFAGEDGKAGEALKQLKVAVDPVVLNPSEHQQSLKLLADLQLQDKKYAEAVSNYKAWLDYTGFETKDIYLRMTQASYELKKYEDMIPYADKAIALSDKPEKAAYRLKLASFYERKMYKDAIKVVETIVRLFPGESQWWVQLSMFYMLIDENDKAMSTMEIANVNGMLSKESHYKTLVQLYYNSDVPYKAAKTLETQMDKGVIKKNARMVTMLANSYRVAQHFDKAAKYYGEAGEMKQDGELFRKQASMLLMKEKYTAAIKAAQKALKLGLKREGSVNMMIAEAYLYQKNLKSAYKYAKLAAKDPSSKKMAANWASYIKDKANRRGIKL